MTISHINRTRLVTSWKLKSKFTLPPATRLHMVLNLHHKGNFNLNTLNDMDDWKVNYYFKLMCQELERKNRKH